MRCSPLFGHTPASVIPLFPLTAVSEFLQPAVNEQKQHEGGGPGNDTKTLALDPGEPRTLTL